MRLSRLPHFFIHQTPHQKRQCGKCFNLSTYGDSFTFTTNHGELSHIFIKRYHIPPHLIRLFLTTHLTIKRPVSFFFYHPMSGATILTPAIFHLGDRDPYPICHLFLSYLIVGRLLLVREVPTFTAQYSKARIA